MGSSQSERASHRDHSRRSRMTDSFMTFPTLVRLSFAAAKKRSKNKVCLLLTRARLASINTIITHTHSLMVPARLPVRPSLVPSILMILSHEQTGNHLSLAIRRTKNPKKRGENSQSFDRKRILPFSRFQIPKQLFNI